MDWAHVSSLKSSLSILPPFRLLSLEILTTTLEDFFEQSSRWFQSNSQTRKERSSLFFFHENVKIRIEKHRKWRESQTQIQRQGKLKAKEEKITQRSKRRRSLDEMGWISIWMSTLMTLGLFTNLSKIPPSFTFFSCQRQVNSSTHQWCDQKSRRWGVAFSFADVEAP